MRLEEAPLGGARPLAAGGDLDSQPRQHLGRHGVGQRQPQRPVQQAGLAEQRQRVEEARPLGGAGGRAQPRQVGLVQPRATPFARQRDHHVGDRAVERGGVGQVALQRARGVGEDLGRARHAAQKVDDVGARHAGRVVVAGARGPAERTLGGHGQVVDEAGEGGAIRRGDELGGDELQPRGQLLEHRRRALAAQSLDQREVAPDRSAAAADVEPGVGEQAGALGGSERGRAGVERARQRRRVAHAIEADPARVGIDPRRTGAAAVDAHDRVASGHDRDPRPAGPAQPEGDGPQGTGAARRLAQPQRQGGAVALSADGDEGVPGGFEPRPQRRRQRPAGRLLDGAPQIGGVRAGELVRVQVAAERALQRTGADEAREHAQHRGALAIDDRIERRARRLRIDEPHRMRRRQLVVRERLAQRSLELVPRPPGGPPAVEDLVGDVRGGGLVQPQIVPRGRRHQIAEPLVRQLMRHQARDAVGDRRRCPRLIDEDAIIAQKNRARVLHAARSERGHGDEVELGKRIAAIEVGLEARQQRRRGVEREAGQRQLIVGRDDGDRGGADGGAQRRQAAHGHGDEIGGQGRRLGEAGHLLSGVERRHLFDGRVGDGGVGRVGDDGKREARLLRRRVEAGERAPRRRRLEVREGVAPAARLRLVEAVEIARQRRRPAEREARAAGGQRVRQRQRDRLPRRVVVDLGVERLAGGPDAGIHDLEADAVELDDARGGAQPNVDGLAAGEAVVGEVGRQRQRVARRHDLGGARRLSGCCGRPENRERGQRSLHDGGITWSAEAGAKRSPATEAPAVRTARSRPRPARAGAAPAARRRRPGPRRDRAGR